MLLETLASPMILFFVLGLLAALAGSDLQVPEPVGKGLALYLMLAIGFKGGAGAAGHGIDSGLVLALAGGVALSLALPLVAFALLRLGTRTGAVDAAAIASHYGSISIVTFVTAAELFRQRGIPYEAYMVAVAAVMESPALVTGLALARRFAQRKGGVTAKLPLREVLTNGSVVLLLGAFVIGVATGDRGMAAVGPFVEAPFKGILCLFLLDMGLVAARRLRTGALPPWPLLLFGLYMPPVGAAAGLAVGGLVGLGTGGTALMATLAASASYIAVPAAMRLALPEANPALYLTLALAVTFPFNLILGIPLYLALAAGVAGP